MNQQYDKNYVETDGWKMGQGVNWGGLFMIALGALFLLNQMDVRILGRSPFVLMGFVPVLGIVAAAWHQYQRDGRFSRNVVMIAVWGLFPMAFVAAAIFGFNMALIWPVALILMGVCVLAFGKQ